ncbi:MAG: HAD-IIIC family phosphatase [Verrucomicrobiota bacterium]
MESKPNSSQAIALARLKNNPSITDIFLFNGEFEQAFPDEFKNNTRIDVLVLAEFTTQNLIEPIRYYCRLFGIEPKIKVQSAYQIDTWLSTGEKNPEITPGILIVLSDFEKIDNKAVKHTGDNKPSLAEAIIESRIHLCAEYSKTQRLPILFSTLFPTLPPLGITYSHFSFFSNETLISKINRDIISLCSRMGLGVLPTHLILENHGRSSCLSLKEYLAVDAPFSAIGANRVAENISRQISSIFTRRKKVLVVDLDNTLWGGILGEDGADSIKYRPDSFEGRVFSHVIQRIKFLGESGIVLAINSKNNESEVLSVLDRSDFPLKREDFAVIKANWEPKHLNLVAISEELSLSLESMVMLDDSEVECLSIRQALPQVEVVQVPKRLSDYPATLANLTSFDRAKITEGDHLRRKDYQDLAKRKQLAGKSSSHEDFLASLKIKVTLNLAQRSQLERLQQLFERTNQFNLTGKRYSKFELEQELDSGSQLISASYSDVFGTSGLIGALLAKQQGNCLHVENFVLSCRVLGRSVENSILSNLNNLLFNQSLNRILIKYIATSKNAPALKFLNAIAWTHENPIDITALKASPHIQVDLG